MPCIDLWLARTESLLEPASLEAARAILSPRELAQCAGFQREADRRRALLGRALLRETLSRYAAVAPGSWEFASGAQGKPELAAPSAAALSFNVSHTGAWVACAVTREGEVGVDVEDHARACELLELGERVLTAEENAALRELASADRPRRFFELWTLKEAYLKARGLGFSASPRSVGFALDEPGRIRATFAPAAQDDSGPWSFALLGAVPGHALALASRSRGARVRAFLAAPGRARYDELEPRVYATSSPPGFLDILPLHG